MENKALTTFKELCFKQTDLETLMGDQETISFKFNGTNITNPFVTEDGIQPVDPIEYYGTGFKESDFYPLYLACITGEEKSEDIAITFFEKEIQSMIRDKDTKKAEETVERLMNAGLVLDFNGLLQEQLKNETSLEQILDTAFQELGEETVLRVTKNEYKRRTNQLDNDLLVLDIKDSEESVATVQSVNSNIFAVDLSNLKQAARTILNNKKLRKAIKKAKKEKK